jgi:hypothetical protein
LPSGGGVIVGGDPEMTCHCGGISQWRVIPAMEILEWRIIAALRVIASAMTSHDFIAV